MASQSLRVNVVRFLFIFAVLTFGTGLIRFFGIYRSPTIAMVHHYSGLVLVVAAVCHMIVNRRPLLNAFKFSK